MEPLQPAGIHNRFAYRHRAAVLERLGVTGWGAAARQLANQTMIMIAETRTDPAELINAAVDALVRHRFELPSLDTLSEQKTQKGTLSTVSVFGGPATRFHPIELLIKSPRLGAWRSKRKSVRVGVTSLRTPA